MCREGTARFQNVHEVISCSIFCLQERKRVIAQQGKNINLTGMSNNMLISITRYSWTVYKLPEADDLYLVCAHLDLEIYKITVDNIHVYCALTDRCVCTHVYTCRPITAHKCICSQWCFCFCPSTVVVCVSQVLVLYLCIY